jgi:hypothetical protein
VNPRVIFAKVDAYLDRNRKIRRGGRNCREVFEWILRQVAQRDTAGTIPAEDLQDHEWVADDLMCSTEEVKQGIEAAIRVRLIERIGEEVSVCGWGDEWGKRPLTTAERQARHKAKGKSNGEVTAGNGEVTESNGAVTASVTGNARDERRGEEKGGEGAPLPAPEPSAPRPPQLVLVSEAEPEQAREERASPAGKRRGVAARAARSRAVDAPVPNDFAPNETGRKHAREHGLNPDEESVRFRNKAHAKGWLYVDPQAGFRTWCDQEAKYRRERSPPAARGTASASVGEPQRFKFPDFTFDYTAPRLDDDEGAA